MIPKMRFPGFIIFLYLDEVCRGDKICISVHLVPESHFFLRNVPEADLSVEASREEELVVPGVKRDGSDEVDVLETAEALLSRDVPKTHSLVHRRRQDEVVLKVVVFQPKCLSRATELKKIKLFPPWTMKRPTDPTCDLCTMRRECP